MGAPSMSHTAAGVLSGMVVGATWYAITPFSGISAPTHAAAGFTTGAVVYMIIAIIAS